MENLDTQRLQKIVDDKLSISWGKFIVQAIKKDTWHQVYHTKPIAGLVDSVEVIPDKLEALRKLLDSI